MDDPLSALLKSLEPIFRLEDIRNEKYALPPIQHLREATRFYDPTMQHTFLDLLKAIKDSMPRIEKWRINFHHVQTCMNQLAKKQKLPPINWDALLAHPKLTPKFQFSALNHATKKTEHLETLIYSKINKPLSQMTPRVIAKALHAHRHEDGFSKKLRIHLEKYPDFLFHLIQNSKKNFIDICSSRLILFLTDQQIAHAIIKLLPLFVRQNTNTFEQAQQLINTLNGILSHGRSISTLLRNKEAKLILAHSIFFQIYFRAPYQSHENKLPKDDVTEEELLKPVMDWGE